MDDKQYEKLAAKIRIDCLRAIHNAGSGHPGGSLSAADIVTALYFREMNIVYSVQGTRRPGTVCGAGRERLLPCRRYDVPSQDRKSFSGTSQHA